jgi:argininosuccinate synthase
LYNKNLATYTVEDTFDHKSSDGFIKIYGLPYKTIALVKNPAKEEVTV